MSDIYFNAQELKRTSQWEYVAFLDIMGTKSHMEHSVFETANFIFKLHAAVLSAWRSEKYHNVFVYPVMDGAYITASSQEDMEKLLVRVFDSLASLFLDEKDNQKRFVIQAGLSYGQTFHGHRIPYTASKVFELDLAYKNNILLGNAMIKAYESGSKASPFGILLETEAVKDSQSTGPRKHGCIDKAWKWFESSRIKINTDIAKLFDSLLQYFEEFKDEKHPLHYSSDRIEEHISRIKSYFSNES